MNIFLRCCINPLLVFMLMIICNQHICYAKTIEFSNIKWRVQDGYAYPGPNNWSNDNVWVDDNGWLHLEISYRDGKWLSAGISTENPLGFGKYWFYVISRADKLKTNATLALFNYPNSDIGPDETNEIDIEFFKKEQKLSTALDTTYTVWPPDISTGRTSMTFLQDYQGTHFTHGFIWNPKQVHFFSSAGHSSDYKNLMSSWLFSPPDYEKRIPQKPLPIYIYFYPFQGKPIDSTEITMEVIIKEFCYEPDIDKKRT